MLLRNLILAAASQRIGPGPEPSPIGNIGIPGTQGFGVGVAPESLLAPLGLSELPGTTNITSDDYGNYQHTNGSIVVFIPKFYYRIGSTSSPRYAEYGLNCIDIVGIETFTTEAEANAAGYALHRAFIDDGKEKSGFFIDKYLASRDGTEVVSVKNGQPISLAPADGYITSVGIPGCTGILADAVVASRTRGYGWNCQTIFMSNALAMISLAHGQYATSDAYCAWYDAGGLTNFPKGCNNNALADFNDSTVTFTSSGETDANKPLTGSSSNLAKTTHNGQACGVVDVNGAINQVTIGVTAAGSSATSSTQITSGKCYVLKSTAKHADLTGGWNGVTDVWGNSTGLSNNFDEINDFLPWGSATGLVYFGNGNNQVFSGVPTGTDYLRSCSGIQMNTDAMSAIGTALYGNDECYQFLRHNLVPLVAGAWSVISRAGMYFRYWGRVRTYANVANGFRAAAFGDN